ncbi:Polyketide synthase-nonribosomal peptide synthetase [Trichoderma ghanense]|uniref:Polyketide synthase-nonribosomal peptide synthetase n=1 Tax=Trichoderma ghanense TaxID=65468 RepID=A0ABY2GQG1_9HYPO
MDQQRQQHGRFREPIAVIGSACRFPGASSSPSKLWELLQQPRDVLKEFDPERLNLSRFHHKSGDTHGATDVGNKSYLLEEDTRLFDAAFFGISPVEAAGMDPQQRILLETVYETFESAGMTLEELRGSITSVHVGCMTSDWANIQARDTETVPKYNATGSANSILSNRISYIFDLKGPSETIDTACSSSLVALHNAARSLLAGDCNAAVVAGVNLILDPAPYINESKLHMLSPDARSRMWDKAANGYARGEGAGALLLKTLSQALKDGDHIEGLVRATGVNSDGQSPGITMPFSPTQTALIRQTYARAGLDPIKDRPQYIECHGTGTPAGDPVEARALNHAFIAPGNKSTENPIFVGSIKTVIGHLEGGAGIAGVIKVLLSIKHRVIPPNLLFKDLNPDIAPYYGPLQIPTTAVPWPKLAPGTPARASVNSFGFGGTNSHAIIESFDESSVPRLDSADQGIVGPLLFSAKSGASLLRSVRDHLEYLQKDSSLDLRDLSALLQSRRTTHRVRVHFSGSSRDAILGKMANFVGIHEKSASDQIGHQPHLINPKEVPGVLGVFTGQGAQWPAMGRGLYHKSSLFRKYIGECEAVLKALPQQDRPKWSLTQELMKDAVSSRISEAALSQPLCSAVQLALVKLLQAAGIGFDAVVGHSSGEIAATFAAGIITLQGAMQIAYYRGLHAKSAGGVEGAKGAMMAVGLSFTEAKRFCSRPEFDGRIKVAASNAPKSVTLSGDVNAITKAHETLQADNVFARRLQVDTAYHSHHMLPCSQPYLRSLLACDIKVMQPTGKCTWISSVRGDTQLLRGDLHSLKGPYWVDNMVRTVLFTQAIESSIWHGGPFDMAIEVGPHPALKGPTEQTLKASYGSLPAYTGVLKRGENDVEAFSSAIGTTWAQLGPAFVDFAGYRSLFYEAETAALRMPKGLPSYSWDHDKVFWREGRLSRRFRLGNDQGHELLGRRTLDDNDTELRWRNVLKLGEMPWLRGHEVLGEVLLPGASYVSIAVQAGQSIATTMGKGVRLIEVSNVDILRPVVVPEGVDGVETLFTTRIVETTKDHIRAEFMYYVCPDESLGSMLQTCNGDISVYLETQAEVASQDTLPSKDVMPSNLTSIDVERVYSLFKDIGLNYSGLFRGISTIDRQLDYASTGCTWAEGLDSAYVVHPAMLDVAFQTMFIAKAHPASRQINSALLPSHIDRVRINPAVQFTQPNGSAETAAEFETWAVKQTANSLVGDLNIYDAATAKTFLQVEGLAVNSVGEQDASSDRSMFSRTLWGQDVTLGLPDPVRDPVKDAEGLQMAHAVERVAVFYVKNILEEVSSEERASFQWYHQRMFEAFEEHIRVVKDGEHPIILPEWLDDEAAILDELDSKHGETIDFRLLHAVGKDLADVVRGNKQMLEVMTKDDMLNRFYMEGYASVPTNKAVGDVMRQLSFKFPRAKVLEIGAGTGGTSWSVLNCIDNSYESYTYTDVSSGFFHLAEEKFSEFAHKMIFKVLDIEQEPKEQGFEEQSYDIVIAALVLHATHDLEKTMRHARSLLKPGGFLVMVELTGTMSVRATLVMGGLPGWWLGENDGRRLSPLITAIEWDRLLQDTGFSGADAVIHDLADEEKHCTALIMSQAVDDDFQRLRSPLSTVAELPLPADPILVIGGKRLSTSKVVREIQKLLPKKWARHTRIYKSIDEVDLSRVTAGVDILSLQDLDEPPFSHAMTAHRMTIIQTLLMNAKNLLWVTGARESQSPRASLIHGIMRVVPSELPQLNVQVLGLEATETPAALAKNSVEMFLRLRETGTDGGNSHREMLWFMEPELDIVRDQIIIPRVVPDVDLNELYNASKRAITKTVDASKVPVNVVQKGGKLSLQIAAAADSDNEVEPIKVHYSLRIPSTSGHELFIIGGRSKSSWVAAVTNVNTSIARVDNAHAIPIDEEDCSPEKLSAIANYVLSWSIAAVAAPNASVLLFEADDALTASVKAKLAAVGAKPVLASTQTHGRPANVIKIHALASQRAIQKLVPRDVQIYIDCSLGASPAAATLAESMPSNCISRQLSGDLVQEALRGAHKQPAELLREACASSDVEASAIPIIPAEQLAGESSVSLIGRAYVTNWKTHVLSTTVQPLNLEGLFRPDKTYFMAGMAGGLGLSICQWMIRNGAKHMVITSRCPQVDSATLEEAERVGATVKVIAMDLTNKESVTKVVQEVRDTMPPIAGVCNAAMVLKDGFFVDMDIDQFNNTLAAKVIGSENLDSVFNNAALDFFILLGSVASVIGNVGQSNYHAANLFMTSLVHQRRARGLAASIIHIAYVTDVGYVTREERDRQLDSHFRKVRLMPTSETDVHHAFAQAVKGGKPDSSSGYHDIIMGIEPLREQIAADQQPLWMKNPRFAHFDQHEIHAQHDRGLMGSTENIRALVDKAEKEEDAIHAVMAAFCAKLESILQLTTGSINVQRPITDLGIDSLVAVEIRTWFLKELGADVPVVKILGGDTVQQLSTIATKKLLAKNMEAGAETTSTTEKPAEPAAPVRVPAPSPLAPSPQIVSESSNVVSADRSPSPTNQPGSVLMPESDQRSNFPTAQVAADFDSESVLTSATSKQDDSISSNSSYTKGETPEPDTQSERPVSVADDKVEMRFRPEILREERMSPAQARLWFMSQHLENPSAYNMAFRYKVKGPIGIARLKHALSLTTRSHECLRMCFYSRLEDGQPMQGLMASSLCELKHTVGASDADVDREMSRLSTRKWDLECGHTVEVSLLSRGAEDHDMIIAYHHIVMDVTGLSVVLADLDRAYNMKPLNKSAGSYLDFSMQQLEQQTRGDFDEQLSFWEAEFKTVPEELPRLPFANISDARGAEPVPDTYHEYRELNDGQFASLKATCQRLRISPFHFHLSLLQVLLSRYTNTDDICIGIVDANRNDHRYAGTVGCFVNMVPVRLGVPPGKTGFADVAQQTRKKALQALDHSAVPFDMILDKIKIPRSSGRTPLFQVALNYRTGSIWEMPLGQAKMTMTDVKDANNPYDLSLGIAETRTGCMVEVYVSSSAYSAEACSTVVDAYMRLLDDFSSTPDLQIGNCSIYDESDIESSVSIGKGPVITFGWPATLSQRFLDMVHLHHADAAVTDHTGTLTYSELMERVNAVSDALIRRGCTSGSHIAVLCEPSIDTVVSMLAILHIGAVYVPLDVSLPTVRHVSMMQSSKPSTIVNHSATEGRARDCIDKVEFPIRRLDLDDVLVEEVRVTVPCVASPDTCSVILFTSGSTGTPKGIMLSQANFVNHLALKTHLLGLGKEVVLQQSSTGFDMSVIQMFCALANGGRLVIAPFEIRRDPMEMASLIRSEHISLSIATPSEYLAWSRYGASSLKENTAWRHICMGGEPITRQLVMELRRLGLANLRVTNCYGPTEITAAASFQTVSLADQEDVDPDMVKYTVGKVLPNYTVTILDASGSPQPVNYTGEICIGGAGVALGYINASRDTASKFIVTAQGQEMYRTGDRGRLLSDGTLLLFGRIDGDSQIKLRGLRIDLQEVELAVLEAADGLLSTVVVSQRGDVLIAHATVSADKAEDTFVVTENDLTRVLRRLTLPQYFIPARVIILSSLPTNANGKLDRKAIGALPLPPSQSMADSGSEEEKMTVGEGELRLLWERVLPQAASSTRIAPSSDFFLLGGNSLLLMKLQAAIRDSMNVIVSTRKLYQASTLRDMARAVDKQRRSRADDDAEREINWAAETAIPKWLLNQIHERVDQKHATGPKSPMDNISVLMTGATTFLGGHLLKSLLESDKVSKVYCIAVPADDQHSLPEGGKVVCYTGSLLSPNLGLNAAEREYLESTADIIVHAGGSGHCLNTYTTLRTPNVVSTQLLASMALPRSIPLLFLSSNRVVLLSGNTSPPAASVSAFPPATDGREGHMMSKWASEVFLENLVGHLQASSLRHQQNPWTVSVHRPSVIVSENAPNSDALNAILRYSILMQSSPRMDNVVGYLDLAQLDTVVAELCQSVIQLGSRQNKQESTDIIFKHHSGGVKVPASELWSHLEKVYGVTFAEVEMDEWLRRAARAGIDPLITAYLEAIQGNGTTMVFPYMGSD